MSSLSMHVVSEKYFNDGKFTISNPICVFENRKNREVIVKETLEYDLYLTYFKTFKQADSYRKRVIKENKY